MRLKSKKNEAFTLPTVVIVSTVMLILMVSALQFLSVSSMALRDQYYNQLAREAAEAGARRIEECWKSGSDILTTAVITPRTNCSGTSLSTQVDYVMNNGPLVTTYSGKVVNREADGHRRALVTGVTNLNGASGSTPIKSYTAETVLEKTLDNDPVGARASQRYWYFGVGAGLDFRNSGTAWPLPINSPPSGSHAFEGSTVVSDRNGSLVFWTNGQQVWGKNGALAQNASGLLGSSSATQAVAAFPLNQEQTRYGIISNTTGSAESEYTGTPFTPSQKWRLYFSEYDTTLNNGNGGITANRKNIDLWSAGTSYGYASEALNAMPNHDGTGYWVYTFPKNTPATPRGDLIYGFLIGPDGNVRQRITYTLPTDPLLCSGGSVYGTINFNDDYSQMLVMIGTSGCQTTYPSTDARSQVSGTVYLLNTNRTTGYPVQQRAWNSKANSAVTNSSERNAGYSADFSPNGQYAYVTQLYPGWLTRYTLSAADVSTTQHTLSHTSSGTPTVPAAGNAATWNGGGQIRRGPDGRMYISRNPYTGTYPVPDSTERNKISCITNPNATGYPTLATLGFQNPCTGVTLNAGTYSWYGLPQMVTVYTPKIIYY